MTLSWPTLNPETYPVFFPVQAATYTTHGQISHSNTTNKIPDFSSTDVPTFTTFQVPRNENSKPFATRRNAARQTETQQKLGNTCFVFALVPNSVFVFKQIVSSERIRIVSLYSAELETSTANFTQSVPDAFAQTA